MRCGVHRGSICRSSIRPRRLPALHDHRAFFARSLLVAVVHRRAADRPDQPKRFVVVRRQPSRAYLQAGGRRFEPASAHRARRSPATGWRRAVHVARAIFWDGHACVFACRGAVVRRPTLHQTREGWSESRAARASRLSGRVADTTDRVRDAQDEGDGEERSGEESAHDRRGRRL